MQGDVQLNGGDKLWVLVGQKSDFYKLKSYGYWTGGSGGTFVAKGDNLSTSTPLIVAGGGSGHRSSNEKEDQNSAEGHGTGQGTMDGWCKTDAQDALGGDWNSWNNPAKVGQDTVSGNNDNLKLGFGHGGKGGYGGQGGNSGASGSPSNSLTSKSHTAGGGAGFYGDGRASLDTRGYSGSDAPVPAKAFRNGGRGGLFDPPNWSFTIANNGGFGGGGSGSWGGTGGGGGSRNSPRAFSTCNHKATQTSSCSSCNRQCMWSSTSQPHPLGMSRCTCNGCCDRNARRCCCQPRQGRCCRICSLR